MNGRAERNSKFKESEIEQIERYFNVDLSSVCIVKNSFIIQNDVSVANKSALFGVRLDELQKKVNISDKGFSIMLGIYEYEFNELKIGKIVPNFKILNILKQNFAISMDWLLYGN